MICIRKAIADFLADDSDRPTLNHLKKDSTNIMAQKKVFGNNEENNNQSPLEENIQEQTDLTVNKPQRQHIKHLLIGSPEFVRSIIHYFHVKGYADVGDWSPLVPNPSNPEEVMSILVRYAKVAVKRQQR